MQLVPTVEVCASLLRHGLTENCTQHSATFLDDGLWEATPQKDQFASPSGVYRIPPVPSWPRTLPPPRAARPSAPSPLFAPLPCPSWRPSTCAMTGHFYLWSRFGLFCFQLQMAIFGHLWPPMDIFEHFWSFLRLVTFGLSGTSVTTGCD